MLDGFEDNVLALLSTALDNDDPNQDAAKCALGAAGLERREQRGGKQQSRELGDSDTT